MKFYEDVVGDIVVITVGVATASKDSSYKNPAIKKQCNGINALIKQAKRFFEVYVGL